MPTKRRRAPAGFVTVRRASEILCMTTSGVYGAIKRGEFTAKRVDGAIVLPRKQVDEGRRARIAFYFPKPKTKRELEEEFVRQMWENDPD